MAKLHIICIKKPFTIRKLSKKCFIPVIKFAGKNLFTIFFPVIAGRCTRMLPEYTIKI
jgi:hypothetical protein